MVLAAHVSELGSLAVVRLTERLHECYNCYRQIREELPMEHYLTVKQFAERAGCKSGRKDAEKTAIGRS